VPSLPSPKTAAKIVLVWVVGNVVWTLLSAASGAIVSGVLRGVGVLDNPYMLVGVGFLVAAVVASIPSWARRRRGTTPRLTVATASREVRVPTHVAPPMRVDEQELQSIAASCDPRFAEYRKMPEAKRKAVPSERVSDAHRDALKRIAGNLRSYLRASQHAFYGAKGEELKAQAFQEHFPELRGQVETWNARIDARERALDDLQSWVASRLHALHYDQPPYGGALDRPIAAAAVQEVPQLGLADVAGCLQIGPYPVVVLPSMKEIDPNWSAPIPDVDRKRVERELREIMLEAAARPESERWKDAMRSLPEVGEPLSSELMLIEEKDVIRGLGDCVLCR
jgi:hypothetical protein